MTTKMKMKLDPEETAVEAPELQTENQKEKKTVTISGKEFELEQRILKTESGEYDFYFLVIDSPDKWAPANEIKGHHVINIGQRKVNVQVSGVTLRDWSDVELKHPMPRTPDADQLKDESVENEHQRKCALVLAKRRCVFFELSTGKSIPGNTLDDKAVWLMQRNPRDIEDMFSAIQNRICNLQGGRLVDTYNSLASEAEGYSVKEFESFEDWGVASESTHQFLMNRQVDDYIIEIPLKGMSSEERMQIETECKDPVPPKIPARDPVTKRFDPTKLVSNFEDPAWQRKLQIVNEKRIAMTLTRCLMFQVPGDNYQEKYHWLAERLVGDVIQLKEYIEREIVGMGAHYDFF